MSISVGAVGTASTVVTPENTAAAVGSGALPVFATPYMIALMENAAFSSWRTSSSPRRRPRRAEARPTPKWPAMRSWKKIHKMSLSFCRKTGYTVVNKSGATRSGKPERSGVL